MKFNILFIYFAAIFILATTKSLGQTIWNGPKTNFSKENNVDWTIEENQDRITDNVWITRQNKAGLFNIFIETESGPTGTAGNPTPSDTEWAYGTTLEYATLTYQSLNDLVGESFNGIVDGENIVLHLITDDIYIDLKFVSWTNGNGSNNGGGGGFSYERSTDPALHTNEFEYNTVKLYPNPSNKYIRLLSLTKKEKYKIYNVLGLEVSDGVVSNNDKIDIQNLTNGLYFLKLNNRNVIKFIKE